jgi:hypothetical protein
MALFWNMALRRKLILALGLQSGAIAANETGRSLATLSAGSGRADQFTLELPVTERKELGA